MKIYLLFINKLVNLTQCNVTYKINICELSAGFNYSVQNEK